MSISGIISDEDVKRVHANANFGDMTPRHVVNEGVVKAAFGYSAGSTMLAILKEHGLARQQPSGCYPKLIARGERYLKELLSGRSNQIIDLIARGPK